ncbi:hypothetical protein ACWCRC_37245 [Streptomyces sp. NPDC001940]
MSVIAPKPDPLETAIDAGFLIVPGISNWLGKSDFQESLDSGLTESFEDYCARISKQEAS